MASVMAICSATRMAPARLRNSAERMGRISMSLHLEIGGGRGAPDAPCGIQSGENAGADRDGDHDQQVFRLVRQDLRRFVDEASIPGAQRPDAREAEQATDDAA